MTDHGEVTELLHAYAGGDRDAFDRLVPMVYDELRRERDDDDFLAALHPHGERVGDDLVALGLRARKR